MFRTKKFKNEKFAKTRERLTSDFLLVILVTGGGRRIKHSDNDGKIQSYKGTKLGYDMICESVNTYQEEKEGYLLNGNRIIKLNNLITNIDKVLVCK